MRSAIGSFIRDRRAAVSILSAILLPAMVGVGALVIEFGGGLLTKTRLQRVADVAAFAAASAYNRVGKTAALTSAAQSVARLNSVPDSAVRAVIAPSPRGDGSDVVQVSLKTTSRVLLARALGFKTDLAINAKAYASIGPGVSPCVLALDPSGAGLEVSSSAALSAPKCGVASNASISVTCGSSVTAKNVSYGGAAPGAQCGSMTDPSGAALTPRKWTAKDPLEKDPGVLAATARLSSVSALTGPAAPIVPAGADIDFGNGDGATNAQAAAIGCSASRNESNWTLTCPSGGTYNFKSVTVFPSSTVKFNISGSATTKYNFSEAVSFSSAVTVDFGPGVYALAKGLKMASSTVTFGAGTFSFGRGASGCTDGSSYSICVTTSSSLTFAGPSSFSISSGVAAVSSGNLKLGAGTSNSYDIGAASNGHSLSIASSSSITFADATSGQGMFRMAGNMNALSASATCVTLPAAAQHDINGFMGTAGGIKLGSGVYTVQGFVAFSAGGGKMVCDGKELGVDASDITLVTGGVSPSSGPCPGMSFCVGTGYGSIVLRAPMTGPTAKLVVLGPTGVVNGGASLSGGTSTDLSGAFYFPKGPIKITTAGRLGEAGGSCLQIIGSEITMSGGSTAASSCVATAATPGNVALVQ